MISIQNLSKSFGDLLAVDHLTLEVKAGEILGFLGPNGAGKTTTIHMLCGVLDRDSGEILWNGEKSLDKRAIGFCPQENVFWPRLTCFEQLTFTAQSYGLKKKQAESRASNLLAKLGLEAKRNTLAAKLSGGMKRRLNVALALTHDPDILIFDEPESGLDPQSRLLVRELIRNLAYKKTIIVTSHNMDEIERLAHRVAIIDNGKLLKLDTVDQLKSSVGEGDLMEISFGQDLKNTSLKDLLVALSNQVDSVAVVQNRIQIRSKEVAEKIPEIIKMISAADLEIEDIQIRKNSLEDVFIKLTGKGLRE